MTRFNTATLLLTILILPTLIIVEAAPVDVEGKRGDQ